MKYIIGLLVGLAAGCAFFFGGSYLAEKYPLKDLKLDEMPIVQDLSFSNFQQGIAKFKEDMRKKSVEDASGIPQQLPNAAVNKWQWHRDSILHKLSFVFNKGKMSGARKITAYVEQYQGIAQQEMKRTGIPASITLAQGILESDAGASRLARTAKNHFGIKCYTKPGFKSDGLIDDTDFYHHELAYDCMQSHDDNAWDRFHMYEEVSLSYRHHSLLLQNQRYGWMISRYSDRVGKTCTVDSSWFGTETVPYYAAWCIGLKRSGYATSATYAQKLSFIIETYELWRFDYVMYLGM